MFTRAFHWSLSWARSIQSIPHRHISLRAILMLISHLCVGLPNGLFPSGFPSKIPVWIPLLPHSCYMPAHLTLVDFILIILGEECKLWSSSLCCFLQPPIISWLLGGSILLSTTPSNTLSLCSSHNARDQVSHPQLLVVILSRKISISYITFLPF
jgi:hypothetical protein